MKKNKLKIVFMGTPDFGVPSLEALIKDPAFEVLAVVTQEDKKVGRKQVLQAPPIKQIAQKHNIKVLQNKKVENLKKELKKLGQIDFFVVIAFGQILKQDILDIPKYGSINVHGSLLPKYRGASCIQASILNQDEYGGISIMKMNSGLDTGPVIHQEKIKINKDTASSLYEKLKKLSAQTLPQILIDYAQGKIKEKKQDNNKASYVGLLKKQDGKIDFSQNAEQIEAFIRAMHPWPGAFLTKNNKKIKIIKTEAKIHKAISQNNIGEFYNINNELFLNCKQGALKIEKLQMEGKQALEAKNFINGYKNYLKKLNRPD